MSEIICKKIKRANMCYMNRVCQICKLRTCRKDGQKRVFMAKFPIEEERCKQWVKVVGKEDLVYLPIERLSNSKFVCGNHFLPSDFHKKKTRLKRSAVPSVGINVKPLPDEMLMDFPLRIPQDMDQIIVPISPEEVTPSTVISHINVSSIEQDHNYCQKVIEEHNITKTTPKPETCSYPFSPVPVTTEKQKLRAQQDNKCKSVDLKEYYESFNNSKSQEERSQKCQRSCEKNYINITTENNMIILDVFDKNKDENKSKLNKKIIKPETGIYSTMRAQLKKAAEKISKPNKICVILFDEIVLKKRLIYNPCADKIDGFVDLGDEGGRTTEVADHALVFMLQSIRKSVKQPIAHYFFRGKLSEEKFCHVLKTVIQTVRSVGYMVIATVCDQAPTHVEALNKLKGTSVDSENLNYYLVDNEKVYIIYDVPHLLKSIRNNLIRWGEFVMDNKTAKWSHLVMVDHKNRTTLNLDKITPAHVDEIIWSRRGIKLATQILSNTVAAVLKLISESIENKQNEREIFQTGEIIEDLDKLFDCTNGRSSTEDVKKDSRENVYKNSFHHGLWAHYKSKLENSYFLNSESLLNSNDVKCINGYIVTISSLQDIWKYVESKKFKNLNLRRLNLDSLENLFELIRQHSGRDKHLTCQWFESSMNSLFIAPFSSHNEEVNCENDNNEALLDDIFIIEEDLGLETSDVTVKKEKGISYREQHYLSVSNADSTDHDEDKFEVDTEKKLKDLFNRFDKYPTVYISGYLASLILKGVKCGKCRNDLEVVEFEHNLIYSYLLLRELWKEKSPLTFPSTSLCGTVETATKIYERDVKPMLYMKNIVKCCITTMLKECDVSWICVAHRTIMSKRLFYHLSCLLIRNDCRIHNQSIMVNEDSFNETQITCEY